MKLQVISEVLFNSRKILSLSLNQNVDFRLKKIYIYSWRVLDMFFFSLLNTKVSLWTYMKKQFYSPDKYNALWLFPLSPIFFPFIVKLEFNNQISFKISILYLQRILCGFILFAFYGTKFSIFLVRIQRYFNGK